MNKRRIIAVLIAFVLTIAATAMWSASTDEREGDPMPSCLKIPVLRQAASISRRKRVETKSSRCWQRRSRLSANCLAVATTKQDPSHDRERCRAFESVGVTRIEDARTHMKKETASAQRVNMEWAGNIFSKVVITKPFPNSLGRFARSETYRSSQPLGVAYDKKALAIAPRSRSNAL